MPSLLSGAGDGHRKRNRRNQKSGRADGRLRVRARVRPKSLVAASLFQRMAKQRGLAVRAVSRGTAPDPSVPEGVVQALRGDRFDVASFRPQALTKADIAGSARVVAIGVDLGAVGAKAGERAVRWDGVPPVSTDYAEARSDLITRIDGLLRDLRAPARAPR